MRRAESRRHSFHTQCHSPTCLCLSSPWELWAPALRQPSSRPKISHGKKKNQRKKKTWEAWENGLAIFIIFLSSCGRETKKSPYFVLSLHDTMQVCYLKSCYSSAKGWARKGVSVCVESDMQPRCREFYCCPVTRTLLCTLLCFFNQLSAGEMQ